MLYNLSILCIGQYQTHRVHLFPISHFLEEETTNSSDEYHSHGQEKPRPEPLLTDYQVH